MCNVRLVIISDQIVASAHGPRGNFHHVHHHYSPITVNLASLNLSKDLQQLQGTSNINTGLKIERTSFSEHKNFHQQRAKYAPKFTTWPATWAKRSAFNPLRKFSNTKLSKNSTNKFYFLFFTFNLFIVFLCECNCIKVFIIAKCNLKEQTLNEHT